MPEKEIETKLRAAIREIGGMCIKLVSPGFSGLPDRIILIPGGVVRFAETKATGRKERPRQQYVQNLLRNLGFTVYSSVDSIEKINRIVDDCNTIVRGNRYGV